jgi:hypothetical protein
VPYADFLKNSAAPRILRAPHLTMVLRSVAGFHRAISLHLLLIRDQLFSSLRRNNIRTIHNRYTTMFGNDLSNFFLGSCTAGFAAR